MRQSSIRLWRAARLAALLTCAWVATATAQTFTNPDPILKRIWDIGMNQSKTWELSQALFDSIGPRLYASPAAKSSSDWIIGKYKSWGIDAKQESYGTWRAWDRGYAHVDLIKPRVHTMDAVLQPWSPGTGGVDVVGATVLIPMLSGETSVMQWLPSVRGKFVLASPPKATCRPHKEWDSLAPPDEVARLDSMQAMMNADFAARYSGRGAGGRGAPGLQPGLITRLEQAGAAGVIAMTAIDGWGTYTVQTQWHNKTMPALSMSCEDYTLLFRLTEQKQGPVVRLNADAKALGTVPVYNTIATVKGSTKPNEYVMLSAHFDSWDAGTGATDNGTGTIVMLEAMRILRQVYPNPKRTIIAGHWVGEEEGLIGSQAFTADHPEIVKGLQALFNQDNGTGRIQNTSGVGLPDAGKHMQQWLAQLPVELQVQIQYTGVGSPGRGGTDHASFDCYGAPGFGLSSASWDYTPYTHHTNRDTFDKIVFDEVKGNATIVAMLVYLASEDSTTVGRERRNLTLQEAAAAARGGAGGRGAAAGGRGGRAAAAAPGAGGRAGPPTDSLGWELSCPKGPRASPDSGR